MTLKLVDEYRFLDPTAPAPVCGMCLTAPVKAAGTLCEPCRDSMTAKSIIAEMERTAAERIDWPGYTATGSWYAPEDEGDPVYAEDVDAPAPPIWASMYPTNESEDRLVVGALVGIVLVLLAAIAWCLYHLKAIDGWPWWAFVLAPSLLVFVCIGVAVTINCWIGGNKWPSR